VVPLDGADASVDGADVPESTDGVVVVPESTDGVVVAPVSVVGEVAPVTVSTGCDVLAETSVGSAISTSQLLSARPIRPAPPRATGSLRAFPRNSPPGGASWSAYPFELGRRSVARRFQSA
jgi:hypothetical protein